MHYPGFFITLEGIEGCGKTTQAKKLNAALQKLGYPVLLTKEPGGTDLGKEIRKLLLRCNGLKIGAEAELLLYAADRAQHVREFLVPPLEAGHIVICDRFADATVAYQGYARGLDKNLIAHINQFATQKLQPDVTILLDLDVRTGLARAQVRNQQSKPAEREDRFEKEDWRFHEQVRQGYLASAKGEPERIKIIDAGKPAVQVFENIMADIMPLLLEKGTK
ncbi:MAG: dTMP kinase [Candidatus Schekmanbacteria bacterium]|nr:dTMP kinase [Candidatus Schekmanbacteria bacterium]